LLNVAKIRPIFKKGVNQDIQNYRPISGLMGFSKIPERLMYNRLICFVYKYDLLMEEHSGFRDGKSTELASQIFIE
jgi:hypothetical protein